MYLLKRKPERYIPWNKGKLVGHKLPFAFNALLSNSIALLLIVFYSELVSCK